MRPSPSGEQAAPAEGRSLFPMECDGTERSLCRPRRHARDIGRQQRCWPWRRIELQRQFDVSVLLLYHTRKNTARGVAAGQGPRGFGDIHVFGDSNLYLRRTKEHLVLSSEHRAAPASPPVYLELVATGAETTHLEVVAQLRAERRRRLKERVLDLLAHGAVLTRAKLRDCAFGPERAPGRRAGVAGASRPAPSHARRLAASRLIKSGGSFPFPRWR